MKAMIAQDAGHLLANAGFSNTVDFLIGIKNDSLLAAVTIQSVVDDFLNNLPWKLIDEQWEREQREFEQKVLEYNRQFPNAVKDEVPSINDFCKWKKA